MFTRDSIKGRLLEYCKYINIPISRFEKDAGLANGYFNQVKKQPSLDKLDSIHRAFPDLNLDWLVHGSGNMLSNSIEKNGSRRVEPHGIPLIPIEAVAGFGNGDQDGVRYEDCEHYMVPEFIDRGVEFLIRVSGSSMYPKYANGDILACKKIHEILFIQWGKVHIIESISQGPLVKRIFEHDAETIRCVSDNKENYPPFLMPKSDIRSLSIVLGVIRLE